MTLLEPKRQYSQRCKNDAKCIWKKIEVSSFDHSRHLRGKKRNSTWNSKMKMEKFSEVSHLRREFRLPHFIWIHVSLSVQWWRRRRAGRTNVLSKRERDVGGMDSSLPFSYGRFHSPTRRMSHKYHRKKVRWRENERTTQTWRKKGKRIERETGYRASYKHICPKKKPFERRMFTLKLSSMNWSQQTFWSLFLPSERERDIADSIRLCICQSLLTKRCQHFPNVFCCLFSFCG